MKRFVLFAIFLGVSAGCAPFKDSYYLDEEFGKDSRAAWDAQIVHKGPPHGARIPEGMMGVTAEEVMSVRNKMFAERPSKSQVIEFGIGGSK